MKYFCTIIFIFLFSLSSFGFEGVSIPQENFNTQTQESPISNEEFCMIEKQVFKKTFASDSARKRLSRLEKEILGMEQKGNDEERFENIMTAYEYYKDGNVVKDVEPQPNYYSPKTTVQNYSYQKQEPQYYTVQQPKQSKVQKFLDDVIDTFSAGTMTGYTPPIYYDTFGGFSNYLPNYTPWNYYHPRYNGYNHFHTPRYNTYNYPRYPQNRYFGNTPRYYNHGAGVRIIN